MIYTVIITNCDHYTTHEKMFGPLDKSKAFEEACNKYNVKSGDEELELKVIAIIPGDHPVIVEGF